MTIAGWALFMMAATIVIVFGIAGIAYFVEERYTVGTVISIIIPIVLIISMYTGFRWYFTNTASGQRALVDQKSDFNNGIERTITIYTADGNIIAQYQGKIDIDTNDGGYIKFDFDGKRYIYYNCFVETIADID